MFLAVKYVRRKLRERKEENDNNNNNAPPPQETIELSTGTAPQTRDGARTTTDSGTALFPGAEETNIKSISGSNKTASTKPKKTPKERLTPEAIAEKKRKRRYRMKIIFGLMAPFTLQALDTTIIASALPFIATDFNEINQLNWIISSFNLTSAAFLPFWAQTADIFGRHATLQASIVIMTIGSAICTGALNTAFGVLLLGRALQGVGAAGVNICVRTILADRVDLAEYAKNYTLFAILAAVSFSIGPVAGGYLTQVSWRWCFAINLPVAAVAIVLVVVLLRKELLGPQPLPELGEVGDEVAVVERERRAGTRHGRFLLRLATIDYGGQLLFLWGLGLLVLALTWAGGAKPWDSAAVLAPLVIGAVLSVAWLVYEYAMVPGRLMARVFPLQRAMMPWKLLAHRDVGLLFIVNFTVGAAMFAIMYFMDLYFALVEGHNASSAGIALLYFLPGLGAGTYMAMYFTNVQPRQTIVSLLLGSITTAVGITVLATEIHAAHPRVSVIYGMMALTGHGVGMRFNPGSLHGLAYFPDMTAAVSCLSSFANPFGGTVALTMMATVFNNKSGPNHADPKEGIYWAFVALIPVMWATVLATTLLGNVWIIREEDGVKGGHEVVHGAYLWSLVTGRKLERVRMVKGDLAVPAATATLPPVVGDGASGTGAQETSGVVLHKTREPQQKRGDIEAARASSSPVLNV
ncbi:major facilitator superfamily domain-containing protein [Podospora didyma]|uniref:Major facilitator superfamily domain-containing protein n=1 Tax=Podospora didyma TaxID=330526 RepID=A0AAE0NQ76_9PEZI|nr:major facilitator superfamily domain-containing protein [Podospora didyma]